MCTVWTKIRDASEHLVKLSQRLRKMRLKMCIEPSTRAIGSLPINNRSR